MSSLLMMLVVPVFHARLDKLCSKRSLDASKLLNFSGVAKEMFSHCFGCRNSWSGRHTTSEPVSKVVENRLSFDVSYHHQFFWDTVCIIVRLLQKDIHWWTELGHNTW